MFKYAALILQEYLETAVETHGEDAYNKKEYVEDCEKIRQVLKHHGLRTSHRQCCSFWSWRSSEYDAGWLNLEDDENIIYWFNKFLDFGRKHYENNK
jgi:hypothetical protein